MLHQPAEAERVAARARAVVWCPGEERLTAVSKRWVRESELVGDASSRRYARLWDELGQSAVVVRYPSTVRARLALDLEVRSWCEGHALRVPALLSADLEEGWAVLEDFGEDDAERQLAAAGPEARLELALLAIDPLAALADISPQELPPFNPPLDRARMRWELSGFELWFLGPRCDGRPSAKVGRWLDDLAEEIDAHPKRVCHRDYHLNNLFVLGGGEVGVIDYQDLLVGPDTYDAVSLLEERGMPRLLDERQRLTWRTTWATSTLAAPRWESRWRTVRIQRGLKVLGTFARLTAGGASGYAEWLEELRGILAPLLEAAAAPRELVDLLLDW
jgi:aminoglycoside/choline kinase family phosphotransferase